MDWFATFAENNFDRFVPHKPIAVVQVGVFEGDATAWLARHRHVVWQDDVDSWAGTPMPGVDYVQAETIYDEARARWPHVHKRKMSSDEFFSSSEGQPRYDFAYIDGDHDPDQTYRDGINAWHRLNPGGVLAFDDYGWERDGISPRAGIDRVLTEICPVTVLGFGYQVWVRKP